MYELNNLLDFYTTNGNIQDRINYYLNRFNHSYEDNYHYYNIYFLLKEYDSKYITKFNQYKNNIDFNSDKDISLLLQYNISGSLKLISNILDNIKHKEINIHTQKYIFKCIFSSLNKYKNGKLDNNLKNFILNFKKENTNQTITKLLKGIDINIIFNILGKDFLKNNNVFDILSENISINKVSKKCLLTKDNFKFYIDFIKDNFNKQDINRLIPTLRLIPSYMDYFLNISI